MFTSLVKLWEDARRWEGVCVCVLGLGVKWRGGGLEELEIGFEGRAVECMGGILANTSGGSPSAAIINIKSVPNSS